jgi:hypothetical protein
MVVIYYLSQIGHNLVVLKVNLSGQFLHWPIDDKHDDKHGDKHDDKHGNSLIHHSACPFKIKYCF